MGYSLVPHTVMNSPGFLDACPRCRFLVLSCWCIPDRRFGGLFSLSVRRLSHYTGLPAAEVEDGLRSMPPAAMEYDFDTELAWLVGATATDAARLNDKQLAGLAANLSAAPLCDLRARAVRFVGGLVPPAAAARWAGLLAARGLSVAGESGPLPGPPPESPPIPLPIPLPIGPVSVSVSESVTGGPGGGGPPRGPDWAAAPQPGSAAAAAAWNRALPGTRLALSGAQLQQAALLRIEEEVAASIGRIAAAVRASKYLRDEAPWMSFFWATRPDNARKLLSGAFPADGRAGAPPSYHQPIKLGEQG